MSNHKVFPLAAAFAIAACAQHASAALQPLELEPGEVATVALVDQSLSLVAALVNDYGCKAASGRYPFVSEVSSEGAGSGLLGGQALDVAVQEKGHRGLRLVTSSPGQSTLFPGLSGEFTYADEHGLALASSNFALGTGEAGAMRYATHVLSGLATPPGEADQLAGAAAEVVLTRGGAPVARWRHGFAFDRIGEHVARYSALRLRLQRPGSYPCGIFAREVALVNDDQGGRVLAYGYIEVNVDDPTAVLAAPHSTPIGLQRVNLSAPDPVAKAKAQAQATQPEQVPETQVDLAHLPPVAEFAIPVTGPAGAVRVWGVGD